MNLKVYFWLDGTKHSWLKVRSSVIRLIKRAFQENGISMPDEAREVIINREVPLSIRINGEQQEEAQALGTLLKADMSAPVPPSADPPSAQRHVPHDSAAVSTAAEAGLHSDAETLERQARNARDPEEGQDLLS